MFRQTLRLFLYGLCMGTADVIPGISGGTVAFVMGFYERLIAAVKNPLNGWKFLLPLAAGMVTAIFALAELLHTILMEPERRTCLYGLFFGLILVSIYFCAKRVKEWKAVYFAASLLTSMAAYYLTVGLQVQSGADLSSFWLVFTGFIAVGAMLLPGISGSYVMMIFGVYPSLMANIAQISKSGFSVEPLLFLLKVGAGIVAGALFFTRFIEKLLAHFQDLTMASLVGFMIGALPAVWPFWEISANGDGQLVLLNPHLPGINLVSMIALSLAVVGFSSVLFLEKLKKVTPYEYDRSHS